jgi:hypothetical protein
MNGIENTPGAPTPLSGAPTASKNKPRVRAQVYQVAGTVQYAARPPAGEERAQWAAELKAALGSTSTAFVEASLHRILAACTLPGYGWPTSSGVSSALALVQAMEPENELQAALAVDAACFHAAAQNLLSRIQSHGGDRKLASAASSAARLERAFHSAVETFYKVKRGNTQVIRVEKIEVGPGGQAMIGQVIRD